MLRGMFTKKAREHSVQAQVKPQQVVFNFLYAYVATVGFFYTMNKKWKM